MRGRHLLAAAMFCVLGCGSTTAASPLSDAAEIGLDVHPDLDTPDAAVEVQDSFPDVVAQDSMALDVASQPETPPDKPSKQNVTFVIRNNLDEGRWVYADANFCATWVVGIDGELPPSYTVPSGGPDLVDTYSFVLLLPTEQLELLWDARVRENGALVPATPGGVYTFFTRTLSGPLTDCAGVGDAGMSCQYGFVNQTNGLCSVGDLLKHDFVLSDGANVVVDVPLGG